MENDTDRNCGSGNNQEIDKKLTVVPEIGNIEG